MLMSDDLRLPRRGIKPRPSWFREVGSTARPLLLFIYDNIVAYLPLYRYIMSSIYGIYLCECLEQPIGLDSVPPVRTAIFEQTRTRVFQLGSIGCRARVTIQSMETASSRWFQRIKPGSLTTVTPFTTTYVS